MSIQTPTRAADSACPNPSAFSPVLIQRARLHEIHDCLTLALDATESTVGYTQTEREARSYIRNALHQTVKLMEAGA